MKQLVGIVVVVASCVVPQQQPGYYPQQPQPGYAAQGPAASCQDTLACYGQCNPMTQECMNGCDQRTTPDSAQNAHAVIQCMATSGCADQNCVAQRCDAEIRTCTNASLAAAPAAAPPGRDAPMTPQLDSWGYLQVPPPQRALTVADLAGEWLHDGTGIKGMYSSSGQYSGYHSVAISDQWQIDASGNITDKFNGVSSGNGGARQVSETKTGTVSIENNEVHIVWNNSPTHPAIYIIRGWFVGVDSTVGNFNGPFWDAVPDRARVVLPPSQLSVGDNWIRKN